jgi:hypothetical protein
MAYRDIYRSRSLVFKKPAASSTFFSFSWAALAEINKKILASWCFEV